MGIYRKLYDEFEIGKEYYTTSRTVTEADVVNFAGLSGDFSALHTNEEYAKKSMFGTRIAYGALTYCISTGLVCSSGIFDGSYLALLGCEFSFPNPVRFGDTITCVITPVEKRLSRKPGRGIIKLRSKRPTRRTKSLRIRCGPSLWRPIANIWSKASSAVSQIRTTRLCTLFFTP